MKEKVNRLLDQLEADNNIKILFAVESGSRAWGFESKDSDYDVRFIYVHTPEYYLDINIEHKKDVIEIADGDLDISGWDLRKALKKIEKGTSVLGEWIQSPIVYRNPYPNMKGMFEILLNDYHNPKNAFAHYASWIKKTFHQYIENQEQPKWKKYLYVIRGLLCCKYILENKKSIPPMRLDELLGLADTFLKRMTRYIIVMKSKCDERERGKHLTQLDERLERDINTYMSLIHSGMGKDTEEKTIHISVNDYFMDCLFVLWKRDDHV